MQEGGTDVWKGEPPGSKCAEIGLRNNEEEDTYEE